MGEIQIQKIQRTVQVKDGDNKRKNEKESDGSRNVTRPIILGVAYRREGFLRPAGSKRPKAERARRPALGIPKGDACYHRDARRGKSTYPLVHIGQRI